MTEARFDPRNLLAYAEAPPLLHFEFGGNVYRYVWVQEFKPKELDEHSHRTAEERTMRRSHADIRRGMFLGFE